jgi:hypothetical protein
MNFRLPKYKKMIIRAAGRYPATIRTVRCRVSPVVDGGFRWSPRHSCSTTPPGRTHIRLLPAAPVRAFVAQTFLFVSADW